MKITYFKNVNYSFCMWPYFLIAVIFTFTYYSYVKIACSKHEFVILREIEMFSLFLNHTNTQSHSQIMPENEKPINCPNVTETMFSIYIFQSAMLT